MFWGVQIFRNIRTHGRSTISEGSIYFKLAVKYMFRGVQIFRNIRTRGTILGGSKFFMTAPASEGDLRLHLATGGKSSISDRVY